MPAFTLFFLSRVSIDVHELDFDASASIYYCIYIVRARTTYFTLVVRRICARIYQVLLSKLCYCLFTLASLLLSKSCEYSVFLFKTLTFWLLRSMWCACLPTNFLMHSVKLWPITISFTYMGGTRSTAPFVVNFEFTFWI